MSAAEMVVRDVVMARIQELRCELKQLEFSLGAMEDQLNKQPLSKTLELGNELRAMEGWVEQLIESLTLIDLCDQRGGATSSRLARFARQLSATVNYWRNGTAPGQVLPAAL